MFTSISNPPPPWKPRPFGRCLRWHQLLGYLVVHLDTESTLEGAKSILQTKPLTRLRPGGWNPKGGFTCNPPWDTVSKAHKQALRFRSTAQKRDHRSFGLSFRMWRRWHSWAPMATVTPGLWLASNWYPFTTAQQPPAPTLSARIQAAKARRADSFWGMSFLRN